MLSANLEARKARHKKVFAGAKLLKKLIPDFGLAKDLDASETKTVSRRVSSVSASTKLFRSYSVAVGVLFVIGMINPESAYSQNSFYAPSLDGVEEYYSTALMSSDDGYISKSTPQTEIADRSAMNGKIIHEVQSGETISTIAEEYNLKTSTVLWENGLSATSTLKIGQKLVVPPVDGVTYTVKKGQDIKKIASLYNADAEAILKQNRMESTATLKAGEAIFIPGAKPLPERDTPIRIESTSRVAKARANVGSTQLVSGEEIGSNSNDTPAGGKSMIFPTRGSLTQGFHRGHYAYDIADSSKPPIWAAMEGTVIKASSGTWGGGFGNHVIIDNGNGIKTLYAHMEYLSVSVGDQVTQGQVIGKMGRSGNVRGRTGIHLHFEVIQNGVKKSPGNYF